MAYSNNYTAKQKQDYHNRQSKKGATNSRGFPLTDFQRGVHHQKAQQILKARKKKALSSKVGK